jgi:predicted RNA binding protein YcfA (HicA-like mRNA interferase family)
MPRVTAREAERAIMRDGWRHVGGTGSHRQYEHPTKRGAVTIAYHTGQILNPRTLSSIIQQAGLTVDQFRALL